MTKESFIDVAASIAFINYIWYSWQIWTRKAQSLNIASWGMGTVICAILLGCSFTAGKTSFLAASYTFGSLLTLVIMVTRGNWKWTWIETGSALISAVATALWLTLSPDYGAIAGVVALNFGGIPMVRDVWKEPNPSAAPMFLPMFMATLITLCATLPWSIQGSLLPTSGVMFNLIMFVLCARNTFKRKDHDTLQFLNEELVEGDD